MINNRVWWETGKFCLFVAADIRRRESGVAVGTH